MNSLKDFAIAIGQVYVPSCARCQDDTNEDHPLVDPTATEWNDQEYLCKNCYNAFLRGDWKIEFEGVNS